jgi:histidyl-tRNA synthetase
VFEWVTTRLGAQGTVCAGGRYDALVDQLGGKPTPAAGFALGVERLIALLEEAQVPVPQRAPHLYMAMMGEEAQRHGLVLAEQLRSAHPWLRLQANCGGGGFKAQFKRADRSGAELALILGDEEMKQNTISVKPLRDNGEQITVPQTELGQYLDGLYAESKLEE